MEGKKEGKKIEMKEKQLNVEKKKKNGGGEEQQNKGTKRWM